MKVEHFNSNRILEIPPLLILRQNQLKIFYPDKNDYNVSIFFAKQVIYELYIENIKMIKTNQYIVHIFFFSYRHFILSFLLGKSYL